MERKNDSTGFAVYPLADLFFRVTYVCDILIGLSTVPFQTECGKRTPFSDHVIREVGEYLAAERTSFDIPYQLSGTPFQLSVWHQLEKIAYGETISYQSLAMKLGNANSSRAVGMACGRNPIMIIIPCHRVVGKNGSLTGYAEGIALKASLLQLEKGKSEPRL